MTPAQLTTLKAAIAAETDVAFVAFRLGGSTGSMAEWYSLPDPAFVVWKTNVSVNSVGDNMVGTEFAGLTSLNATRLQTIAQYSPSGINPSMADRRQFFDDVFSGAGGVLTRAKLLILWKRMALRGEKLYATGTGTDTTPATLAFEGRITNSDVLQALAS